MNYYPNAAQGLKMMFWAEIAAIACVVLMVVPLVNILAMIAALAASIISMVGLYKAGSDDEGYKTAFILTIVNLVLELLNGVEGFFGGLISIASAVVGLAIVYYVCTTTARLLTAVGSAEVAEKSNVWKLYMVCTVVEVACVLVSWVPVLNVLAAIAAVISAIVMLVAEVLYMIFLYKSYQALGA